MECGHNHEQCITRSETPDVRANESMVLHEQCAVQQ